jgi:hypothetical protein
VLLRSCPLRQAMRRRASSGESSAAEATSRGAGTGLEEDPLPPAHAAMTSARDSVVTKRRIPGTSVFIGLPYGLPRWPAEELTRPGRLTISVAGAIWLPFGGVSPFLGGIHVDAMLSQVG